MKCPSCEEDGRKGEVEARFHAAGELRSCPLFDPIEVDHDHYSCLVCGYDWAEEVEAEKEPA